MKIMCLWNPASDCTHHRVYFFFLIRGDHHRVYDGNKCGKWTQLGVDMQDSLV